MSHRVLNKSVKVLPFILLTLYFCCGINVYSQTIPFQNFTSKNGLPQNFINDIYQDSHGFIWIASQVGVTRYDGYEFKTYGLDKGLANKYVQAIKEIPGKGIYIRTLHGLSKFENNRFIDLIKYDEPTNDNISDFLFKDYQNRLWLNTPFGLSMVQNDTVHNFSIDDGLIDTTFLCAAQINADEIWFGTLNGIMIWKNGSFKSAFPGGEKFPGYYVRSISKGHKDEVWIGFEDAGIVKYDQGRFIHFGEENGLKNNIVLTTFVDRGNNIWVGNHLEGIHVLIGSEFKQLSSAAESSVLNFTQDNLGNIWAATFSKGIYKIDPVDLEANHYTDANNLISNDIRDVEIDLEGNIWIGTRSGISKYGKGIFELYATSSGLPEGGIFALNTDYSGNLWCGSYNGLYKIENSKVQHFPTAAGEENQIVSIMPTQSDGLLLGTFSGISRFYKGAFQHFKNPESTLSIVNDFSQYNNGQYVCATSNGVYYFNITPVGIEIKENILPESEVIALYHDKNDHLWCATSNGLYVILDDEIIHINTDDGLPHDVCTDITADEKQDIWVSTDGGVAKIKLKSHNNYTIDVFTQNEGLLSNTCYLVAYSKGFTWVGHENGLSKISTQSGDIIHYNEQDGFTSLETNEGAVAKSDDGTLWFGTVSGIEKYNPRRDYKRVNPPITHIIKIQLLGEDTLYTYALTDTLAGDQLQLKYSQNDLNIDFTGIHFTVPEKNLFRYKLENYDENWSEPSSDRQVGYRKIPPGSYTFKVIAANSDGIWNQIPVSFSFHIQPPLWQRPWFYALELLIILGLIVLFVRYRTRKLLQDKKILAQKVAERTKELETRNEEIQAINKELEQQKVEIQAQRDLATQQRDQIALQNKEITSSIIYAKRIQTALLPSRQTLQENLPNSFTFFRPRDIVSGDFYWITKAENRTVVVAADCTGHGVPGAFMSILGVSSLHEIVIRESIYEPGKILDLLKENVMRSLSQSGRDFETRDGMDIALSVIDHKEKTIDFAGAYNPLYYVRDNELFEVKANKMPIGYHIGEQRHFFSNKLSYKNGDVFYMFSDGYTDQFGGEKNTKFKIKPFKNLLLSIHHLQMSEQKKRLEEEFVSWKGDYDQIDDVLVMGFRL